jgi:hypothetical protein
MKRGAGSKCFGGVMITFEKRSNLEPDGRKTLTDAATAREEINRSWQLGLTSSVISQ